MMLAPTDNGVGPESTARALGVAVKNGHRENKRFAGQTLNRFWNASRR
jgi:hypothetical protein